MTWKETDQKGTFSRPIGEDETFIKTVGDAGLPINREHLAINSTITVEPVGSLASADLPALFRFAWTHLRFQHPSIAAVVAPDDKHLHYIVPADDDALSDWVSQTFSVASDTDSAADLIPTFHPSPYAKLVYIPRSKELLIHTTHWRTDAFGVLLLFNALLTIAASSTPLDDPASLPWGTEVDRLTPSIEDAASMPKERTPELKERGSRYVDTFSHIVGAIGIPYLGNADTLPAGTRSAILTLDPETTSKVITACKKQGITVTSAVHASVAGANYALTDAASRTKHYASTVRFALRKYLPEPYSTPAYAAALCTTGWTKRVEANETWAERLQSYQDEYRQGISREFLDSHREYARQLTELIRNLPQMEDPPSDVDISSLGIAENLIHRSHGTTDASLEVKAVNVGVEVLTRQGGTFVWTFRDQLNFNVVYNESYHTAEQMSQFVAEIKNQLVTGLGI